MFLFQCAGNFPVQSIGDFQWQTLPRPWLLAPPRSASEHPDTLDLRPEIDRWAGATSSRRIHTIPPGFALLPDHLRHLRCRQHPGESSPTSLRKL